jgi:hypothetical protein
MKHCPLCQRDLDTSEFWASKSSRDGLHGYCKQCATQKNQSRYKTRVAKRRNKRYITSHANRQAVPV